MTLPAGKNENGGKRKGAGTNFSGIPCHGGAAPAAADPRRTRGHAGELLARRHLEREHYAIIETNYASRYGEIDIIASKDGVVSFVEVKARRDKQFGEPFEAVGPRKRSQIRRMAEMWLAEHQRDDGFKNLLFRFDVISILLDEADGAAEFIHIKNAFD